MYKTKHYYELMEPVDSYWETYALQHNITVFEQDDTRFTGLLDEHGEPIFWFEEKEILGF